MSLHVVCVHSGNVLRHTGLFIVMHEIGGVFFFLFLYSEEEAIRWCRQQDLQDVAQTLIADLRLNIMK